MGVSRQWLLSRPQMPDVDAQMLYIGAVRAPHRAQELTARGGLIEPQGRGAKENVLLGRQVQGLPPLKALRAPVSMIGASSPHEGRGSAKLNSVSRRRPQPSQKRVHAGPVCHMVVRS